MAAAVCPVGAAPSAAGRVSASASSAGRRTAAACSGASVGAGTAGRPGTEKAPASCWGGRPCLSLGRDVDPPRPQLRLGGGQALLGLLAGPAALAMLLQVLPRVAQHGQ